MRGIQNEVKRRSIFDYCRQRADIVLLQETHATKNQEKIWTNEWGGKAYFANGASNARGVAIFIKKDIKVNVIKKYYDKNGRFIILEINVENQVITLGNIYGPNTDDPEFFVNINKLLEPMSENKILIGDFNVALDDKLDRYNSKVNRQMKYKNKAKAALRQLMSDYLLEDIWRLKNEEKIQFSWTKRAPGLQASRIDFAIVSRGLCQNIVNSTYVPAYKTDHSAFFCSLKLNKNDRGVGYWKLNTELLSNAETVDQINKVIKDNIEKYKAAHPCTIWERVKTAVTTKLKENGRKVQSENKLIISQLLEKIGELESNMPLPESLDKQLCDMRIELEEKVDKSTRAAMFRCKTNWVEHGERCSKYFFNLEKTKYNAKTINTVIDEDNKEWHSDSEILKVQSNFYAKLYKKDEAVSFNLQNNNNDLKIDEKIKENQAGDITRKEIIHAIKNLNNNKTPGNDGLPIEFYKVFCTQIVELLCKVFNCVFEQNEIFPSAMEGVLNLIPKPGKDPRYIGNLRPITLLNTDYKIIEKILAERMKTAMENIINFDQRGFMAGRRISTNIRKIYDLMAHCEEKQIQAFILNVDFKKCFDQISFCAIIGALKYFNFSDWIIRWTEILYSNYTVKIQNNGHFSDKVCIERSVHQGGVNSVNYFLCVAEILAINLRNNVEIKGIPIQDVINLLNQYADDMDVSSLYDQQSLNAILKELELFQKNTGFEVNYDKTSIYRIGSLKNSDAKLYTQKEISWTNDPVNVLGIWICNDFEARVDRNYELILQKMKDIFKAWENRNLSLIGKILVVNTLVASLFVYKLTVLENLPETLIKDIESQIQNFIWNGARAKIPIKLLQQGKQKGGLKLVDIRTRKKSLNISWIKTIINDPGVASIVYEVLDQDLKQWIFDCNLSKEDVKELKIKNKFWEEVLEDWSEFNYDPVSSKDQCIWWNSRIRINNKPFKWRRIFQKGLFKISQLYENGTVISANKAGEKFGLSWLELNNLITAIPNDLKKCVRENPSTWSSNFAVCMDKDRLSAYAYDKLLNAKSEESMLKIIMRWENLLHEQIPLKEMYRYINRIWCNTNIAKLRSFQYRLMCHALVMNTDLYKWGKIDHDKCSFCLKEKETIIHFFVQCDVTHRFLLAALRMIYEDYGINTEAVVLSVKNVLFNSIVERSSHVLNFILLLAKQYLYRQRCQGKPINVYEFRSYYRRQESIEKYIAKKNGNMAKHVKKWGQFDAYAQTNLNVDDYVQMYIQNLPSSS